jgi:beta-phosphoglucomutase-like phosphatase (HAD superfamily)
MDQGCQVTTAAIQNVFRQRGIEITEAEANSRSAKAAHKADATSKKSALRHVMLTTCAEKWKAATGAEPTEWDLEALFKEFPRVVSDRLNTTKPINGAVEVVNGLKAKGCKVAITSNF